MVNTFMGNNYRKNSKIWDTSNNCHNCPKNRKVWCNIALMHPKDADGMANSVDPDQTASSEAVWSWSALFAETYLSQYIEFVQYQFFIFTSLFHLFMERICSSGRTIFSFKTRPHFGRYGAQLALWVKDWPAILSMLISHWRQNSRCCI